MARKTVLTEKLQRAVNAGIFTPEEAKCLYDLWRMIRVTEIPEEHAATVGRFTQSVD